MTMKSLPEQEEAAQDEFDPSLSPHDESDDDDDAPEGISFKKSKEDAISSFKQIKSSIQSLEEDVKIKRKQQEIRNTEQKKLKLSSHILKEVDQVLKLKEKKSKADEEKEDVSPYDCITDDDFLAETARTIQQSRQYQKPMNESASQFKHNRLYGNNRIRRVDAKQTRMLQSKYRNRNK